MSEATDPADRAKDLTDYVSEFMQAYTKLEIARWRPFIAGAFSNGEPMSPLKVIEIALTYLPIDCDGLYEGCLSSAQAHDGAQRVVAHLGGCGFEIVPAAAGAFSNGEPHDD